MVDVGGFGAYGNCVQHGPVRAKRSEEVSNSDFTESALVPRAAPARQWIYPE